MTDRQLLERIDGRVSLLAESVARHLGDHEGANRLGASRAPWLSVAAAWVGAAVALATLLLH